MSLCSADRKRVVSSSGGGKLTGFRSKLWERQPPVFHVRFIDREPEPSYAVCAKVVHTMNEWGNYANVEFRHILKPAPEGAIEIRVTFRGDGYWALCGNENVSRDHPVNMCLQGLDDEQDETEFRRVVLHETGHILGFEHEHMREEIVSQLDEQRLFEYARQEWDWDEQTVREQILTPLPSSEIEASELDVRSIMFYELPSFVFLDGRKDEVGGIDLSPTDKKFVAFLYPKVSTGNTNGSMYPKSHGNGSHNGKSRNENKEPPTPSPLRTFRMPSSAQLNESNAYPKYLRGLVQRALLNSARGGRGVSRTPAPMKPAELIMNALMNNIVDTFTSTVQGNSAIIDTTNSFIQFAPIGLPINPDAFKRLLSPVYPLAPAKATEDDETKYADLGQTEYFSQIVNRNSYVGNIEQRYSELIFSASAIPEDFNADAKAAYQAAFSTLYAEEKDEKGNVVGYQDSPIYKKYKQKELKFRTAIFKYRNTESQYDLTKPSQQRAWLVKENLLDLKIKTAKDEFDSVKVKVQQALNVLKSMGQSLPATVIAQSRDMFEKALKGSQYRFSTCFPSDWATQTKSYAKITINTEEAQKSSSQSSYSFGASASYGFFFGGNVSGSGKRMNEDSAISNVSVSLQFALVQIDRPWFSDSIFSIGGWYVNGLAKGKYSLGQPPKDSDANANANESKSAQLLPSYPTHFIVAREVEISANWSSESKSLIEKNLSTGINFGYGIFSLGGKYEQQSKEETFSSKMNGNTISIPGMQIIGWVNKVVPVCPPLDRSN